MEERDPDRQRPVAGCPFTTDRRRLLLGFGVAAGGTLAGGLGIGRAAETRSDARVADAPQGHSDTKQRQPFYGFHQGGVVTPRPATGIVASFAVIAETPGELETLFRTLTERITFLTHGGAVPELDPKLPPADSGILGPVVEPDNLTVTVALGASLFEDRPWLNRLKPRQLQRMAEFPNDALEPDFCHGDLMLQFCANSQDTNIHALRDILKAMSEFMVLVWKQEGNVPVVQPMPDGTTASARNFLGFRDGSANPDSRDGSLMDRIVWIGAADGEPDWAVGGTYQAVRIIRNFVERWDRTPLVEQEKVLGRVKASGAPLDGGRSEHDEPDFARDPHGRLTPLDSHIRLANPRTPESAANLILRRPFNYSNGVTKSGQLDQGLLFICFQADLEKGFIAVQNRLNGEPLEEYIKPVGGGYFYVLPGARRPGDYVGQSLIEAISRDTAMQD